MPSVSLVQFFILVGDMVFFVILILSPILQRPHWHQIVHRFSGFSGLQQFNLVFVKVVVEVCILYVKGGEAKFSGHLYVMLWERWLLIVDLENGVIGLTQSWKAFRFSQPGPSHICPLSIETSQDYCYRLVFSQPFRRMVVSWGLVEMRRLKCSRAVEKTLLRAGMQSFLSSLFLVPGTQQDPSK